MRRRTRFDSNQTWRQLAEVLQHLCTTDALADHNRARDINSVHLKDRLRNIQTNRANFTHGRLPSMWFVLTQPPYGTSMPQSGRRPQHQSLPKWAIRTMSGLPSLATKLRTSLRVPNLPTAEVTRAKRTRIGGRAVTPHRTDY